MLTCVGTSFASERSSASARPPLQYERRALAHRGTRFLQRAAQTAALITASFVGPLHLAPAAEREDPPRLNRAAAARMSDELSRRAPRPDLSELEPAQRAQLEALQATARQAKERAEQLRHTLEAVTDDKEVRELLRGRYAESDAFRSLRRYYARQIPRDILDFKRIGDAARLPESEWGCRMVMSPVDRTWPGILIVSDEAHALDVDDVVTELRNKTTSTLLARHPRWLMSPAGQNNLRSMRATSIIIGKPEATLDCAMLAARLDRWNLPYGLAGFATLRGEAALMNAFPEATYAELLRPRTEAVGPGARTARRAANYLTQALAEQVRAYAFDGAYDLQCRALAVGKPLTRVGLEIDVADRYPIGVHYWVKTKEGRTYRLYHVGRNFSEKPQHDALSPRKYSQLNVTMLTQYRDKGAITRADLYRLALEQNLYPIEEGWIIYLDPDRVGEWRINLMTQDLTARVNGQGFLQMRDVQDAANRTAGREPRR